MRARAGLVSSALLIALAVLGLLLVRAAGSPSTPTGPATAGPGSASSDRTASPRRTASAPASASVSAPASATGSPGSAVDPETGVPWVELASLPVQVRATIRLIEAGGPFPYAADGQTFGNRERLLPARPAGYYREYTVPTPGSPDRGARRVVTGDRDRIFLYTHDHYASFRRIRR